ncbi:hypothetical protein GOV11_00155 [Candidatus Woesearchaeota archaeon]|nr:hypothetical protein [Candidatus Woesearchaeota archaeon]
MRRGQGNIWGVIVTAALAVLVLVLISYFVLNTGRGFSETISCGETEGSICVSATKGCDEDQGYEAYLAGTIACKGRLCCVNSEIISGGGNDPGGSSVSKSKTSITVRKASGEIVRQGAPLTVIPEEAQNLEISGKLGSYKEGETQHFTKWGAELATEGKNGQLISRTDIGSTNAYEEVKEGTPFVDIRLVELRNDIVGAMKDKKADSSFSLTLKDLKIDPKYQDELIKFSITIYPANSDVSSLEQSIGAFGDGMIERYFIYFKTEYAVRYAGLTQTWDQEKHITAGCEYRQCENIYYEIIPESETECKAREASDFPSDTKSLSQNTKWCLVDHTKKDMSSSSSDCKDTLQECFELVDATSGAGFNTALEQVMRYVDQSNYDEEDYLAALYSLSQEQTKQQVTCEPNVEGTPSKFKADTFDSKLQRATFDLNLPYMMNKNLCVYGKGIDDDAKIYSAGPPQRIMVDLQAPTANIDFSPWSLNLRFSCHDGATSEPQQGSGCTDRYAVAYITRITDFIPALVSGKKSNAIAWCPDPKTGAGYSYVSREMPYTGRDVRVLCLRVQDNAGNAGVAMTTVYNAYDAFTILLAEALD